MQQHKTTSGNYFVRWLGGEIENNLRSLAEAARVGAEDADGYIGRIWYVNQGTPVFIGYADDVYDELALDGDD
jgi:hypothetical protein